MKIDHNVAAPAKAARGRTPVYPIREMQVGDSIAVDAGIATKARLAFSQWKKLHQGFDYTSQSQADGTVRIWRIG